MESLDNQAQYTVYSAEDEALLKAAGLTITTTMCRFRREVNSALREAPEEQLERRTRMGRIIGFLLLNPRANRSIETRDVSCSTMRQ